jgi:sensor domain CHASE-containing protein
MTFVVNQDGIVYEKDLGSDTPKAASLISDFNPDISWRVAK